MAAPAFKMWRMLKEQEVTHEQNRKYRVMAKKEFVGKIVNPKREIYPIWMEFVELSQKESPISVLSLRQTIRRPPSRVKLRWPSGAIVFCLFGGVAWAMSVIPIFTADLRTSSHTCAAVKIPEE
jgi:hypothetical protein